MFRIDRRFVRLTNATPRKESVSSKKEAGAEGENPEAAASDSMEINTAPLSDDGTDIMPDDTGDIAYKEDTADKEFASEIAAEELARGIADSYLSEAEKELNKRAETVMKDAREKAEALLTAAREEAAETTAKARDEAADIRVSAREEGFNEGKAEGIAEGKRLYEEKLAAQRKTDEETLNNVLDEIAREMERIRGEQETDTAAMALEIVRKIIKPAEDQLGTVFTSLIKNAFRQISLEGKFTIRLSPVEYERFFPEGSADIELDSGTVVTASVVRDTALNEGDLIIDTEDSTVNAGIETQLRCIELVFDSLKQAEEVINDDEQDEEAFVFEGLPQTITATDIEPEILEAEPVIENEIKDTDSAAQTIENATQAEAAIPEVTVPEAVTPEEIIPDESGVE